VRAAYQMLRTQEGRIVEILDVYTAYDSIRHHVADHTGNYEMHPVEFLKLEGVDVCQAYEALRSVMEALRMAECARRLLDCHLGNVSRMQPAAQADDRAAA
jgi:hypothetical protein